MENINFVYVVFDKKTEEQLIHEKAQCLLRQPQDKWDEWFVYIQHLRDTVENISCGVCSYNRDEEIRDFDITLKNKDLIKTKGIIYLTPAPGLAHTRLHGLQYLRRTWEGVGCDRSSTPPILLRCRSSRGGNLAASSFYSPGTFQCES